MTSPPPGPPPGENPDDVAPQAFPPQDVPPAYRYNAPPPPGYPPPPAGYPYPPQPQPQPRISIGMVFLGPLLYAGVNLILGFMAFFGAGAVDSDGGSTNVVFAFAAVLLAVIAFGGGALLLRSRSPHAKGLGIGLMIGWALVSLFTAGFCTGINPTMYTT